MFSDLANALAMGYVQKSRSTRILGLLWKHLVLMHTWIDVKTLPGKIKRQNVFFIKEIKNVSGRLMKKCF